MFIDIDFDMNDNELNIINEFDIMNWFIHYHRCTTVDNYEKNRLIASLPLPLHLCPENLFEFLSTKQHTLFITRNRIDLHINHSWKACSNISTIYQLLQIHESILQSTTRLEIFLIIIIKQAAIQIHVYHFNKVWKFHKTIDSIPIGDVNTTRVYYTTPPHVHWLTIDNSTNSRH